MLIMLALVLLALIAGCTTTKLVPQAYFPEAPSVLMRPPVELKTIAPEQPEEERDDGKLR